MVETVEKRLTEVGERIHELRIVLGISPEEAAGMTGLTVKEYLNYEQGKQDLPFSFIQAAREGRPWTTMAS